MSSTFDIDVPIRRTSDRYRMSLSDREAAYPVSNDIGEIASIDQPVSYHSTEAIRLFDTSIEDPYSTWMKYRFPFLYPSNFYIADIANNLSGEANVQGAVNLPAATYRAVLTSYPALPILNISNDIFALPGITVDINTISEIHRRKSLIDLIHKFVHDPFGWSPWSQYPLSIDSANAAISFLDKLPIDKRSPKIAPDSDGTLELYWEDKDDPVLLTIDGWTLHFITSATTVRAVHHKPVSFTGADLPKALLDALPSR